MLFILTAALMADAQTLFDSFDDGNFSSAPAWSGDDANWTIVANSDAAAGAVGSNTLRLNVGTSVSGTQYLSAAITSWGSNQEWGFWVGRRNQAFTASNQMHIWLYANEANLKSPTVDGYRLVIGDNSGDDEIALQAVTDGAPSAILTSAQAIPNGLTDFGFLIRVTRSISGNFELFTSTLPTSNGTGAVSTAIPNATNANISQGTANNTLYTPSGTGYVGVVASHTTGLDARQAVELDQIYFTASSPDIIITGGPLSFGNIEIGKVSAEQTYSVSGTGLSGNITITAPTHFQISTTSGAGFSSSLTLTPTSGTVSGTTIYVRMSPSAAGNISGVITHTSAGASQEDVAVSGTGVVAPVCTISDDFTDNNFTSAPSWTGNTTDFAVISSATIPNGSATTDGAYLASNASAGNAALTTSSAITSEWRFSLATPSFSPSDNNYFGVILMSDVALTGDITATSWNGYYLRIGDNAPGTDKMKLYRRTGMTSTLIGEFPASPSFSASALSGGLNLRITRDPSTGEFEVFYSSGFLYGAVPTVSAGKLTDATHSTSTYFGVFQRFNNPGTDKRIYFDHLCAFERAYVWLPVSGVADWTNASNWSPPRTSPANSDILLFNRGGASVASNIPTSETVRQIHISNNTQVSLRAAGISGASLTISGAPGDDFVVESRV
ncbi:MAG: hypothetical protein KatS3mg031_1684 [Chitinophagales bacterium]|nr:MAG: hypothetical protein KatS3mg031_1684 [Chitinophagales bacterium]